MKNLPRLRSSVYSPTINPLMEPGQVQVKRRYVTTGLKKDLTDMETGEITGASVVRTVEEKDDAEFVKVFASGIAAMYDLTKTAQRVFQRVLEQYQAEPMHKGYADSIQLTWFGEGLNGAAIDLSEPTFNRGLRELLAKGFIAPRTPTVFWVNPALFFKGDRVLFVKEYVRKRSHIEQEKRLEREEKAMISSEMFGEFAEETV
ncbi:MAG: hypothetical protein WCI20_11865 [bacterium]